MSELNCPNIRFGTFELDINKDGAKMKGFTSIFVIAEEVSDETIKKYASILIGKGCRDFAFCGVQSDRWHCLFDDVDIAMADSEDDYANTWSIDNIEEIPDSLCICQEDVFIFCTDYGLVRKCHSAIVDANYGFKVKYLGEDTVTFPRNKIYTVLSIEKGWYRVMSELEEDYLLPPEVCEEVQE